MSREHIVAQGEHLSSIARRYGFADYRAIYDYPENAEFKRKRPDPNVVFPGARVVIPGPRERYVSCATGKLQRFRLRGPRVRLRLTLNDGNGGLLANVPYTLVAGAATLDGTTDGRGVVEQALETDVNEVLLTVWPGGRKENDAPQLTWTLLVGHLDPVDTISGIQARLANLGYDPGPTDGIPGPRTERAIRAFQRSHQLTEDGAVSAILQRKLKDAYGS